MRPISKNHNLFKEAIFSFNKKEFEKKYAESIIWKNKTPQQRLYGYLLLDFYLPFDLKFNEFTIFKSIIYDFNNGDPDNEASFKAFISPVLLPEYVDFINNAQLYNLALSSICSFIFGRPVLSPKGLFHIRPDIIEKKELLEIATIFPVEVLGTGATITDVTENTINLWKDEINILLEKLKNLDYKNNNNLDYSRIMQAIRLIHLSHLNRREDYDLSFSFLVAGIESIAQIAVLDVKSHNGYNLRTLKKSLKGLKDETLKGHVNTLIIEYEKNKNQVSNDNKNKNLKLRFCRFILEFYPKEKWVLEDGNSVKRVLNLLPKDFNDDEIERMIKKTYDYRSSFFHEGMSTPHNEISSYNIYFEASPKKELPIKNINDTKDLFNYILTIDMMSVIAKNTINKFVINQQKIELKNNNIIKEKNQYFFKKILFKISNRIRIK